MEHGGSESLYNLPQLETVVNRLNIRHAFYPYTIDSIQFIFFLQKYLYLRFILFTLLKDQLMHLFRHFYIHIKTPEKLLKLFYKSVIYK
jgi:hypothetical protein